MTVGNMARIDAVLPDDLDDRFRLEVAKRYGNKKGNMLRGITEAIDQWTATDESKGMAKKFAKGVRNAKDSMGVRQHSLEALAAMGIAGRELLADIGTDSTIPDTLRELALRTIKAQVER